MTCREVRNYRWNVCVSTKFICSNPRPQDVMLLRGEVFGRAYFHDCG
jgi:hypothetical protein